MSAVEEATLLELARAEVAKRERDAHEALVRFQASSPKHAWLHRSQLKYAREDLERARAELTTLIADTAA